MDYILLLIGFVLLIVGADVFVDGATTIARIFGIPSVIIGLTIVALGTSAPEAVVSVTAGMQGSNGIAIGNVTGSSIFNIAMVIGLCALVKPINVEPIIVKRDLPVLMLVTTILFISISNMVLSKMNGLVLAMCCILYIGLLVFTSLKLINKDGSEENGSLVKAIIYIAIGVPMIIFGGELVVDCARNIALGFDISEAVIGLTIVAIGTSLPELVTSIVAARKGESDLAVGNVVGSNIFNLVFVLGLSAMLTPIPVDSNNIIDLIYSAVLLVFLYLVAKFKGKIGRIPAFLLVCSYIAYTFYLLH